MNKKEKEALVLALAEKGETYREITKKAGVSPNTIKAVLNRVGFDISSYDLVQYPLERSNFLRPEYSIKKERR